MKDFVDEQVKKFMDMQESLWEKMIQAVENKERERISREEQWRRQESARLDLESRNRARERAWIDARNKVLMDALDKATNIVISSRRLINNVDDDRRRWNEGSNEMDMDG